MRLLRSRYVMAAVVLSMVAVNIAFHESPAQSGSGAPGSNPPIRESAVGPSNMLPSRHLSGNSATKTTRRTTSATTTTVASGVDSRGSLPTSKKAYAPTSTTMTASPTTSTTTSTTTTTAKTTGPTFGVSIPSLIIQTPATQAAWLTQLKSIGITSIRVGADWSWVQYADSTSYDWSQLDQVIDSIRAAGMTTDLVIIGCPPWAAVPSAADDSSPQPANPAAFGTFAAAVAARYAPLGVSDFEIWNEPNNAIFWQPAPNPAAYTADLRAAYASIKAVDPWAFVITGGLAPEPDDGTNISAVTFLSDMYADGAKGSFDAIGYHPYSYPALPNTYELWSGWSQMSQTPSSIEGVLAANGDASKPLWLTEVGAPSSGPDGVGTTGQAEELTQAIADAKASSWIGALYIYTYEDSGGDPSTDEDWFGLLNADGSAKPAWAAVKAALQ